MKQKLKTKLHWLFVLMSVVIGSIAITSCQNDPEIPTPQEQNIDNANLKLQEELKTFSQEFISNHQNSSDSRNIFKDLWGSIKGCWCVIVADFTFEGHGPEFLGFSIVPHIDNSANAWQRYFGDTQMCDYNTLTKDERIIVDSLYNYYSSASTLHDIYTSPGYLHNYVLLESIKNSSFDKSTSSQRIDYSIQLLEPILGSFYTDDVMINKWKQGAENFNTTFSFNPETYMVNLMKEYPETADLNNLLIQYVITVPTLQSFDDFKEYSLQYMYTIRNSEISDTDKTKLIQALCVAGASADIWGHLNMM